MNWQKAKDLLAGFITGATATSILYGIALSAGWIVDKSIATAIAQGLVQSEQLARTQALQTQELAHLEFVLEMKWNRLRYLNALGQPSPDDRMEMDLLRQDIEVIRRRIAVLKGQPG